MGGKLAGAHLRPRARLLLSKFTDPKRLFGPIDVAALTQGHYTQVFDGRATQADVAFIDATEIILSRCRYDRLNPPLLPLAWATISTSTEPAVRVEVNYLEAED